jgi:general secretion pathway protein H
MISRCSGSRNRYGQSGFTLIEMMVVLAIMASMIAIVANRASSPISPTTHARAAVRAISGALRSARSEALMTNRSVAFNLDIAHRRFWWGDQPANALTEDLNLALLTSRNEVVADAIGRIRFDPDGGSSGGRVAVAAGSRTWWVGVNWLSGRVSIAEKQQ